MFRAHNAKGQVNSRCFRDVLACCRLLLEQRADVSDDGVRLEPATDEGGCEHADTHQQLGKHDSRSSSLVCTRVSHIPQREDMRKIWVDDLQRRLDSNETFGVYTVRCRSSYKLRIRCLTGRNNLDSKRLDQSHLYSSES